MLLKFIPTMTTGLKQTFGKFSGLAKPGLRVYIPFIQSISLISNRLKENDVPLQVRTKDNVLTGMDVRLQYRIKEEDTEKAFFSMQNPISQMRTFTGNVVRHRASDLTLDELFESQSDIEQAVLEKVYPKMLDGGFTIESVQVLDINPPRDVTESMNEINASQRRLVAAENDGKAHKIKEVLRAEADAERKRLQGEGIASMRDNIINGWTESIKNMSKEWNTTPRETMEFVLRSLNFETMENMSKNSGTKVIFYDKQSGKMDFKNEIIKAQESLNVPK